MALTGEGGLLPALLGRVLSTERWAQGYPAMIRSWENSWEEFVPFFEFPPELRKIVYTTNSIESMNARFRRAVRHRGHFPTERPP